jgi:hypothetical protein
LPRLVVRRADRRKALYQGRIARASTEKSLLFCIVGWLLGEYYAAEPGRRPDLKDRLIAMAERMNEEARR